MAAKIGTALQYQDEVVTEAGMRQYAKAWRADERKRLQLSYRPLEYLGNRRRILVPYITLAPKTPEKTTPPKKTQKPTGKTAKQPVPTSSPDATTSKQGVVVYGIALRKDLGKVRRWLEDGNPDLGKTVGIRWLRKKTLLVEEGKKTSSIVVYLEGETSVEKVRLGGKWLRVSTYESDRGRK
ncbi:hypothetical protein BDZ91DRAFT_852265 [Kalaharituber pfeilii]|nr:hypothetical protein BDZ91DRAFT_852265 [Kalaharituber pfeilii]